MTGKSIEAHDVAGFAGLFLLAGVYLFFAAHANADLTAGRFVLFMDERLTFDGVRAVLHPHGLKDFWYAVSDGGDQRYGRSLWNLTALISFFPDRLWGDTGLIIADRMAQAFFLLGADILLCVTFVRAWRYRLLLLFLLLTMPFAAYYTTLPKPEPLQLLFLAIFLNLHQRRGFTFGAHWLVLGLAFGTKISTLPAVVLFTAVAGLTDSKARGRRLTLDEAITTASYFSAGLALAVPTLLNAVVPMLLLYHLWRASHWGSAQVRAKLIVVVLAILAGAAIGHDGIKHWIGRTLFNTEHGDDQPGINAFSWVGYLLDHWLGGGLWLNTALVAGATLLVLLHLAAVAQKKDWRNIDPGLLVIVIGAALDFSIFVGAHRLWGFYLVPGTTLILAGLVCLAEHDLKRMGFSLRRTAAMVSLLPCAALAILFWAPGTYANFEEISRRTQDPVYRREYQTYGLVMKFLADYAAAQHKKLDVVFDPQLYPPQDGPNYVINEFFGPYAKWDFRPDVIVLAASHTSAGEPYSATSPEYPAYVAERAGYARFVIAPSQACRQAQCYERALTLPDGGEILVRKAGSPA